MHASDVKVTKGSGQVGVDAEASFVLLLYGVFWL